MSLYRSIRFICLVALSLGSTTFLLIPRVDAQTVSNRPAEFETCNELKAIYPAGIAKSAAAKTKTKLRAAVVRRLEYKLYEFLDLNRNGIACDKADKGFSSSTAHELWGLTLGGIQDVNISATCKFSDYRVEYGTKVGFASLTMQSECETIIHNWDRTYSLYVPVGYYKWYAPFNFDRVKVVKYTDEYSPQFRVETLEYWTVLTSTKFNGTTLKPGWNLTVRASELNTFEAERSVMEAALLKLRSGLRPTLYLAAQAMSNPDASNNVEQREICLGPKYKVIIDEIGQIGRRDPNMAYEQYGCELHSPGVGMEFYYFPWDLISITKVG